MNIEEAKKLVRGLVFNDDGTMVSYIDFTAADYDTWGGYTLKEYAIAIETLLTAYEKEKEKNKNIDEFCRKELAFERRLKRENREPDEFNQGRFYVSENIRKIIKGGIKQC